MRISAKGDPLAPTVIEDASAARRRAGAVLAGMALTVLAANGTLRAQAAVEPLVPDRPGLYCGSLTVPKGFFQVESGVAFQRSRQGTETSESITTPIVFRLGVSGELEFRVITPGFVRERLEGSGGDFTESGFGTAALGVKWRFADAGENGTRPSMAFLFTLGLPVGSDFARPERVEPSFLWAADLSLPANFGLSTNAGISARFDDVERERFGEVFLAAALGRPISPVTGLFVEIAGTLPQDADSQVVIDGGVTHLLNGDVQLDFSATKGLTRAAGDWALGGGVSFRIR